MSPVLGFAVRALLVSCVLIVCGCTTMKTTNTARSSTEQMLVSNAVDQALDKIVSSVLGAHCLLEEKYVDCVDKAYVIGSFRHRLLQVGAQLVDKADDAAVVVEPRSGTVGTTNNETYVGIPEITLPGMLTLPEIRVATRSQQVGVAKLGVAAFDRKTRTALGVGGTTLAKSDDSNLSIFGVGPFQSGSIRNEITRSTSGPAGITRTQLPVQVAFQVPAPEAVVETPSPPPVPPATQTVEYTEEAVPAATEAPAEGSESDAPGWAQ